MTLALDDPGWMTLSCVGGWGGVVVVAVAARIQKMKYFYT
jgi:hypothetical protein